MGKRSRKRPVSAPAAPNVPRPPAEHPVRDVRGSRGARSEQRDAAIRAELAPLEPGERPAPLVVAAVLSALLALANVAFYAAGVDVQGTPPALGGVLAFAGIMLVAAWGLWTQRYWAVLGFQALLAITIVVAALSVLVASNIAAVALCLTILVLGTWLFWKLVRVLGRMKVPRLGE